MATDSQILNYLVAWEIGDKHGMTPEEVLAKARDHYGAPIKSDPTVAVDEKEVEEIYRAYPSKDIFNGNRPLPKTSKDKDKIRRLLTLQSKESILSAMRAYLRECDESHTYKKYLSTFLNNIPDYSDPREPKVEVDQASIFE